MKRVLQIVASLRIGGAEKIARDLGYYADSEYYETHYIVFGDEIGEYEQDLIDNGCLVFHWPEPALSYSKYLSSLKCVIRENHYDVVHAHTMFNIGWAMMVAKYCGVPVRIAHAHSALSNGTSMKKWLYEETMRRLIVYNSTDYVACGEAAGIRLFGEKMYRRKGKLVLNGIDIQRFTFDSKVRKKMRQQLHIEDAFVVGHVGHLAEVKNQSFLIRLMPNILKCRPNAKLLLLGDGKDRLTLEQLIKDLQLEGDVIMTGNVQNVPDYLDAMDVFAFPSLFEGMPLSILEVQANGLPCIMSTNVPTDVIQTSIIRSVSLNSSEKWIQAICNARRIDSVKYAEELLKKGFDINSVIKRFFKIYERDDMHD